MIYLLYVHKNDIKKKDRIIAFYKSPRGRKQRIVNSNVMNKYPQKLDSNIQ